MLPLYVDTASMYARAYYVSADDPWMVLKKTIRNMLEFVNPTHALWIWDGDERKSDKGRKPKPYFYHKLAKAVGQELVETFGGMNYVAQGEADDAVASGAVQNRPSVIASTDSDLDYLMVSGIRIYDPRSKRFKISQHVLEKWNVHRLSHVPIVKAIVGDSGDGITGVRGIGPKRARAIYQIAVPEPCAYNEALEAVKKQLTESQLVEFDEALRAVMLYTNLHVPAPRPVLDTSIPG